jgi:hypothetical protein
MRGDRYKCLDCPGFISRGKRCPSCSDIATEKRIREYKRKRRARGII